MTRDSRLHNDCDGGDCVACREDAAASIRKALLSDEAQTWQGLVDLYGDGSLVDEVICELRDKGQIESRQSGGRYPVAIWSAVKQPATDNQSQDTLGGPNAANIERLEAYKQAWADIDVIRRRIAGSRQNGSDAVLVEHATMERLIGTLEGIAVSASGGLTSFSVNAKHAQLKDIAKLCAEAGFLVSCCQRCGAVVSCDCDV